MEKKLSMLKGALPKSLVVSEGESKPKQEILCTEGGNIPVFVSNHSDSLINWSKSNHELIEEVFSKNRAILFRGFKLEDNEDFYQFSRNFANELVDYTEASTPRTKVADKVYTSTEYPAEEHIPLHNEHSYSTHWPLKIWFYCIIPAKKGGETPIADSRKVLSFISKATIQKFQEKGVMYVRNYGQNLDLKWQDVFMTHDKNVVEAYCGDHKITCIWKDNNGLRTEQVSQALFTHPETHESVWFNQAHLFHISNIGEEVRQYLIDTLGENNLPRNSYYGDGTPIEDEVLAEIRTAYERSIIAFPWQAGDILMLDNVLYAHGRFPFEGPRKVCVTMADPYTNKNS